MISWLSVRAVQCPGFRWLALLDVFEDFLHLVQLIAQLGEHRPPRVGHPPLDVADVDLPRLPPREAHAPRLGPSLSEMGLRSV